MIIKLVFDDWIKNNKSIYNTVFKGSIELDEQSAEELQEFLNRGYTLVFEVFSND